MAFEEYPRIIVIGLCCVELCVKKKNREHESNKEMNELYGKH